ncbi:MAG: hypothetical protein LBN25_04285, partial [Christensenellaceae bacterium]|nr:hypothetical protein [Christensenellaceae bacterium]
MVKQYVKTYVCTPSIRLILTALAAKVYTKVSELDAEFAYSKEPVPFALLKAQKFTKIKRGEVWNRDNFGCAWFHFSGKLPPADKGRLALLISLQGEGVTVNGNGTPELFVTKVQSFADQQQPASGKKEIPLDERLCKDGAIDFYLEAGSNYVIKETGVKLAKFKQADVVLVNDGIKGLYYDIFSFVFESVTIKDKEIAKKLKAACVKAYKLAGGFSDSSLKAAREYIASVKTALKKQGGYKIFATGHAHLDLAWQWPVRETQRKAGRTFANALLMLDKYPGYVFGASQPQQFEWMERQHPELFARIKEKVDSGKIELQGGMWVE